MILCLATCTLHLVQRLSWKEFKSFLDLDLMLGACNVSSKRSSLIRRFNMDVQCNRFVIWVMYLYVVQDVV